MKPYHFENLRFWITAPLAAAVLMIFGLYFWGLRQPRIRDTRMLYLWALFVGLPMAVGNISYNVVVATFVFWRPPVWRNSEGGFSPFFTTRLKAYRREGRSRLVEYLAACINDYDPGHFEEFTG